MYVDQSIMVEAMCMLGEHYETILEAYAGKPKQFIKCEGYLTEIVNELNREAEAKANGEQLTYKKKITKDYEYNKKLETELANFFKVKEVNIWWQSGSGPNAYTILPLQLQIVFGKKNYLAGNSVNYKINICIYEECVTLCKLTPQELMAVILHEIGHNFYYCPITNGLQIFYFIVTLPAGIINQLLSMIEYEVNFRIDDAFKKYAPIVYNACQWFNNVYYNIQQFIMPLNILAYAYSTAMKMSNPVTYILNALTGYGNENGADSMCAKYGYGPEQASALQKMEDPENTLYGKVERSDTSGIFGFNHDMAQLSLELISMISGDPHPNSNQRASNTLKKLKKDLATNDYPDGMKKDLEQEIKRMEDMFEVCSKNSSPSNLQVRQGWYNLINAIAKNNSDFRQIFAFYFDSFRF